MYARRDDPRAREHGRARKLAPAAGVSASNDPRERSMSQTPETRPTRASPPRQVLDPAWEDELRAGQTQEGESGSLEAELAVLHLLRHARAPEPLSAAAMEEVWGAIAPVVAPRPWWRRAWVLAGVPALAGAAALLIALLPAGEVDRADTQAAMGEAAAPTVDRVAMADGGRREAEQEYAPRDRPSAAPAADRVAMAERPAASEPSEAYAPPPPPAAPARGFGRASTPPMDALDEVGGGGREAAKAAKATTTKSVAAEDRRTRAGDGDRPLGGLVATRAEPRAEQRAGDGAFPGIEAGELASVGDAEAKADQAMKAGRGEVAILLEQQFAGFEPGARRELGGRVELRRAQARGALLASARGAQS
jgi:hypothetical protein